MLIAERAAWRDREDAMRSGLHDAMHWRQAETDYHDMLQAYYSARFTHQQHVYRLNQVLYGNSIVCAMQAHEGGTGGAHPPQPPQQQQDDEEMACSPVPRPPLQPHSHANLQPTVRHVGAPAARKRAPDEEGGWAAGLCSPSRQAKRHHH